MDNVWVEILKTMQAVQKMRNAWLAKVRWAAAWKAKAVWWRLECRKCALELREVESQLATVRARRDKAKKELAEIKQNLQPIWDGTQWWPVIVNPICAPYRKQLAALQDLHRPRRYPEEVPEERQVWVQWGDKDWQLWYWLYALDALHALDRELSFTWLPLAALPTGNTEEKGTGE